MTQKTTVWWPKRNDIAEIIASNLLAPSFLQAQLCMPVLSRCRSTGANLALKASEHQEPSLGTLRATASWAVSQNKQTAEQYRG